MIKVKSFFAGLRARHIWMLCAAAVVGAFHCLTGVRPLMNGITAAALWIKRLLARILSVLPFSFAELLAAAAVIVVPLYIIKWVVDVVRSSEKLRCFYRRLSFTLALLLTAYAGLCLFLGASYYADGFQAKSGLYARKSSVEELYATTAYFTQRLASLSNGVERDENGVFCEELDDLFDDSLTLYDGVAAEYDFLGQKSTKPKRVFFSEIMSIFNYTGFYFPFTGEANINVHQPAAFVPSTIAHEMAHQRGIASEQEANFVAILTCARSGHAAYDYSGCLMAFVHLGNALYGNAPEAYWALYDTLPQGVKVDLAVNNAYWDQYETKAAEATEKVYDGLLKSYGQEMGVRSYGACVDLLVAAYLRDGGI